MPSTPTSSFVITPNYEIQPRDGGTNYNHCWLGRGQYLVFADTGYEYWHMHRFKIGSAFPYGNLEGQWPALDDDDRVLAGDWGRMLNWHVSPGDPGGDGPSSLAVDFLNGILYLHAETQNNTDWRIHSGTLQKDVWHTIITNVIFGRTDGTTPRPGRVKIWLDGSETPSLDTNTTHPNGISNIYRWPPNQTEVWFLQGFYTRDLHPPHVLPIQMSYGRLGTTLQAMKADTTPNAVGVPNGFPAGNDSAAVAWSLSIDVSTRPYPGNSSTAAGPATVVRIADSVDSDYQIPASLGGTPSLIPTITSFTPGSGPIGTTVTITGTNFTGATSVKFNGVST